jgi:hypothetical protein
MTATEPILRRMKWETETKTSKRVVREAASRIRANSNRVGASKIRGSRAAASKAAKRVASRAAAAVSF